MAEVGPGLTASGARGAAPRALVLVFAGHEAAAPDQMQLAHAHRGIRPPVVAGVIHLPPEISLSTAAAQTQELRTRLRRLARESGARLAPRIVVSHRPASEISQLAVEAECDLLIFPWAEGRGSPMDIVEAMEQASVMVKGPIPPAGSRALVCLETTPDSELSLRLALGLARETDLQLTVLRPAATPPNESSRVALEQVLEHLSGLEESVSFIDDGPDDIRRLASDHPLLLAGMGDERARCQEVPPTTAIVLARAALPARLETERNPGLGTISILVDKWFAENTFHASEFEAIDRLIERKHRSGLSISLALPALNEEETIGDVIRTLKSALMEDTQLIDEMILVDSNSTDATRSIAADLGIPVHIHQQVLPQYGARPGKGEALWKSLYLTRGDLVLWVDTDIVNMHSRFVYGLVGPMLLRKEIMLVKGFYRRPMRVGERMQAGGGGRVTELTARPLLNLFYPALSGLIQPLSGEYGGRRSALEQLPFSSGYGVEIGLLIDTLEKFGLGALAQVDLTQRVHHNQPLPALSQMSFAIIQTVIRRIDRRYHLELLRDVNRSMKLVQHRRERYFLEVAEIAERERPPMSSLPEYRAHMAEAR
jgi:hypothetical protein